MVYLIYVYYENNNMFAKFDELTTLVLHRAKSEFCIWLQLSD